ncbi:hypothetical protein [Flavobacterium sp.]|uniref:hypothetical protein n=1 Tax=Flavobacterium sp. TaxID=239 RepID=UPI003753E74F
MKKFEYIQPEFFFCEIAIKNNSENDNRIWIYHRLSLSLIEFINVEVFDEFKFRGVQDRFEYLNENWFGVFVQDNCEITGNDSNIILKESWDYLEKFLKWEDNNANNNLN